LLFELWQIMISIDFWIWLLLAATVASARGGCSACASTIVFGKFGEVNCSLSRASTIFRVNGAEPQRLATHTLQQKRRQSLPQCCCSGRRPPQQRQEGYNGLHIGS
jgi:hypothetical protein